MLDGQASNDTLEGGNSEDLLVGGGGNDSLDGGEGVDRAVFSGFFADYDVTWDAPTGQYKLVHRLGSDGIDVVKGVEQFQFADGIRDAAMLVPGSGAVLVGTAASDTLVGGDGADRVQGLEGVDQLDGRGGDDTLEGGAGNDNLFGGGGKDLLVGGEGIDTAYFMGASWQYDISWNAATREYTIAHRSGSEGIDVLTGVEQFAFADGQRDWSNLVPGMGDGVVASGTAGDDSMFGGAGYDLLQGNDGRDVINGWLSADTLEGGAGDDQLAGGAGNDSLVGGEGKDAARYSGASWEYDIAWNAATRAYTIAHRQGADGIDLVRGVELFAFADGLRDWATLVPGAGDGLVQEGGAGHDYLWGSAGYDLLRGNDGSDLIDGWGANDTLDGGNGDDRLTGGAGNDTLIGGAGMDVARYDGYAWQYDIRWDAATRAYTIAHRQGQAQDGVDVVSGVELFGFADGMRDWGNLVPGAGDGVTLEGGLAGDTLTGSAGYDALRGNDGHDLLDGGSGADTLDGGNGDDRLLGGTGNDTLSGGAGMDVAQFLGTSWDYDISWDAVTRQYTLAHRLGHDGVDVVAGVEQFAFADGIRDWGNLVPGAGDGLVLQGTEADEAFASSAGYDLVDGAGGNDILNGQGGADTLIGGDGDDFLSGGSGNDSLAGGAGVDTAQFAGFLSDFQVSWDAASSTFTFTDRVGGEGADVLSGIELVSIGGYTMPIHSFVPGMGLQLTGTATNDWLVGSHNDDTLLGLEGADWLEGDDGNDTLAGGDGIDRLAGGGGNDVLTGGAGADLAAFRGTRWDYDIRWDAGARHYTVRDLVAGRDGTDTVSGAEQFEFVDGNRDWGNLVSGAGEGVVLEGTAGNDELRGGAGYDLLRGGDGYDWLDGGSANDTLFGGASEDRMVGGAGQDVFVFDTHADSMPDWIYDFQ
ncbi:MAG TPA: calcium-binding protein, partial [Ramlibacter sp.]